MRRHSIHPVARRTVGALLILLGALLVWAMLSLPSAPVGLTEAVDARLDPAGVESSVTAVLLNFRAYDTLLELTVLFLALLAIWELGEGPAGRSGQPVSSFLSTVVSLLTPLMVLVGGYLLWAGSAGPGGAFHAGAVIAAAGILLLLAGLPTVRLPGAVVRSGVVIGPLLFVAIGLGCIALGRNFLEYPPNWSTMSIMLIEAAGTVSIALILGFVFSGRPAVLSEPHEEEQS